MSALFTVNTDGWAPCGCITSLKGSASIPRSSAAFELALMAGG
jgi:hypothetical protein